MDLPDRVLIVGASVRAQVESALRAGFAVDALDLFADRDTRLMIQRSAIASSADNSVASSLSQIRGFTDVLAFVDQCNQCDGVIVCGGIENRIELVEALEKRIKLIGSGSGVLSRIRNSVELQQTMSRSLSADGINLPSTVRRLQSELNLEQHSGSRAWLAKKDGSSGGFGIALADSRAVGDLVGDCDRYFQERVTGECISVLYLSRGDGQSIPSSTSYSATTIVGVTQQLVGDKNVGANEFQYCGSIGPYTPEEIGQAIGVGLETPAGHLDQIQRIGDFLAQQYGLVGVWGIDFIVNDAGVWPVDVNARLTASAELYESKIAASSDFKSIVGLHVAACIEADDESAWSEWGKLGRGYQGLVEGKLVLFNRNESPIQITSDLSDDLMAQFEIGFFGSDQIGATLADVPCAGDSTQSGHPILTIRVRCSSADEVRAEMQGLAKCIYRMVER